LTETQTSSLKKYKKLITCEEIRVKITE